MITNFIYEKFDDLIGFENENEFLPNNFDEFNSIQRHRRLFLNLINNILKDVCQFNKYEQIYLSNYSLKKAFEYKIKKSLPTSNVFINKKINKNFKFNFCRNSTIIINNYLNKSNFNSFYISKKHSLKVANLIGSCFSNNQMRLLIDKHLLFHEFVLKKIKKLHKDKEVIDLGDSICIKSDEIFGIRIYTSWKDIKVNKPDIKNELDNAIKSIKKGEFYQVYLAYPKNDTFKKHIPIYVDELKNKVYQIKAIPYSLRSVIK